jgi:hypothetical protein
VGTYIVVGHIEALIAGVVLLFPGAGPTVWSIKTGLISAEVQASAPRTGTPPGADMAASRSESGGQGGHRGAQPSKATGPNSPSQPPKPP